MKPKITLILGLTLILTAGCEYLDQNKAENLSEVNVFVLCEGNYAQSNASLWSFNPEESTVNGPIYRNLTGQPLGDIGQSMALVDDRLFVVNNNSHTIEEFSLGEEISHVKSIALPGASPRYMTTVNNKAYITCWYLNGIVVMDLNTYTFEDTLAVDGLAEYILAYDGYLYISVLLNSDWSSANRVLKLNMDGTIAATYEVVPGPGQMLVQDGKLYVASTYYDNNWNTYAGTSSIDLSSGAVQTRDYGNTFSYGADLVVLNDKVYRTYEGGVAPLDGDLNITVNGQIGSESGVYSAAAFDGNLYLGLSDFEAPDEVKVLDQEGTILQTYQVGAIPGSFLFYKQ